MNDNLSFSSLPSAYDQRAIRRQAERDRALYLASLCKRAAAAVARWFGGEKTHTAAQAGR